MKRLWITVSLFALTALAIPAMGADPAVKPTDVPPTVAPAKVTPATEVPSYQLYPSQRPSPQAMVQQNAEARASIRLQRLLSLKWMGVSPQRPGALVDPINSEYSGVHWQAYHYNWWIAR